MEPAGRLRLVNRAGPAIPGGADFGHGLCRGRVGSGRFPGVRRRAEEPGLDYIDISGGGLVPYPGIPLGPGDQVPYAARIRPAVGMVTMAVGMISQPRQAEKIIARGRMRCEVMHRLEWVGVGPRRNIRLIDLVWRAGGRVWPGGSGPCPGGPDGNTPVDYSIIFGAVSRGQGVRSPGAPEWAAREYGREPRRKKPR